MSNTYLFAGASSAIAIATKVILQELGHKVIGISTKQNNAGYDEFYTIEKYDFNFFPKIEEAIDGIVYFPGTINLKPFHRLKSEEFREDYQINAFGAIAFTQTYLANLKKSPAASIVYISSVAVGLGLPFHSSISMAKGALEGLTKALAAEYAPLIRANCIAPSLVDSPLAEKFLASPDKVEAMKNRNPMRTIGQPVDIANLVVFLLQAESRWLTGQIINLDGGMSTLKNT